MIQGSIDLSKHTPMANLGGMVNGQLFDTGISLYKFNISKFVEGTTMVLIPNVSEKELLIDFATGKGVYNIVFGPGNTVFVLKDDFTCTDKIDLYIYENE